VVGIGFLHLLRAICDAERSYFSIFLFQLLTFVAMGIPRSGVNHTRDLRLQKKLLLNLFVSTPDLCCDGDPSLRSGVNHMRDSGYLFTTPQGSCAWATLFRPSGCHPFATSTRAARRPDGTIGGWPKFLNGGRAAHPFFAFCSKGWATHGLVTTEKLRA
jgi:hypothetical protein